MRCPANPEWPDGQHDLPLVVPDHVPDAWVSRYGPWACRTVRGEDRRPSPAATTAGFTQALLVVAAASLMAFVAFWSLAVAFALSGGAGVALAAGWAVAGWAALPQLRQGSQNRW